MQKALVAWVLIGGLWAPAAIGEGRTPRLKSLKQHMWASELFAEQEAHESWSNAERLRCHALRDGRRACEDRVQIERDRRECELYERMRTRHGEIFGGSPSLNMALPGHCARR